MNDLIQDFSKIRKKLLINDIFTGLFLSTVPIEECKTIPLAAVSINKSTLDFKILLNPDEWFKLSEEVKYGVAKHETSHLAFFHLIMSDLYSNQKMANVAMDLEVNQYIPKAYLPIWGCFLSDFQEKYPSLNLPINAGAMHYYKELSKLTEEQKEELGIDGKARHIWIITDSEGNPVEGLSESEKDAIRVQVEATIEQIVEEVSKSQGHVSHEISELVKGFKKPKPSFNYSKYIRNFIGNGTRYTVGTSRIRENPRFENAPKVILKPLSKVAIYLDESYSVNETVLRTFLNDIYHLKKKYDIHIFPFDTQILKEVKFGKGDSIMRTQCGGTDPECCLKHYKKNGFHTGIIYTDGFFSPVSKSPKEILWVIDPGGNMDSTKNQEKVIKIPKD